ncbi:hypothetical protein BDK51DRAFT_46563 [Blyttiomyces helicus]|uniref:Uncharacterized protein n=1 Tax=Blyttiomyces helicus TaxID=388810 RepID=A0A4P9WIS0_9FUNG|nr:hypothetical protein BDK51DRAFT_46563 [Blyttiomyces helicus]|eukprot:RKO90466.1 hypothetical protein BDK51DRAFT_46563 [Blyttiomyces helicus]
MSTFHDLDPEDQDQSPSEWPKEPYYQHPTLLFNLPANAPLRTPHLPPMHQHLPSFSTLDHALDFPNTIPESLDLAPPSSNFDSGRSLVAQPYSPLPNSPILHWSSSPIPSVRSSPFIASPRCTVPSSPLAEEWVPVQSQDEDSFRFPLTNYNEGPPLTDTFSSTEVTCPSLPAGATYPSPSLEVTIPSPLTTPPPSPTPSSPPRPTHIPTIPPSPPKPAAKTRKLKTTVEQEVFCATCAQPVATLLLHGSPEATEAPHRVEIDCVDCELSLGLGAAAVAEERSAGKKRKADGPDGGGQTFDCDPCRRTVGVGGLRSLVPGHKEWLMPGFEIEVVCTRCIAKYKFCSEVWLVDGFVEGGGEEEGGA